MDRFLKVSSWYIFVIFFSQIIVDPLQIFLSNELTYTIASPIIKLSLVYLFRRIFNVSKFRLVSTIVIVWIALWGVAVFLAAALQCRPLKAFWVKSIDGHCFDGEKYFRGNQVINIILDFVLLALPMPMVYKLHVRWQDKVALAGVFILGGL